LRFQQNNLTDAITYLGKAVASNKNDANAHWNLGLALARKDTPADNKRATTELNAALKINPQLLSTLGGVPSRKPAPSAGGTGPGGSGGSGATTATTAKTTTTS
jgi:hypothetical protein